MASTSASSLRRSFMYDVFLSFRGEDTRKGFVDHLYYALHNRGITTYKDSERIEKGEKISDQLIRSIEESRFYIVVFSKDYASSSWCLDELVQIMKCQMTKEQTAFPVFYDVEPTEVRKQSGAVEKAFAKNAEKEGAERWRNALFEAGGLAGWELKTTFDGHEASLIQDIVKEILLKLHRINLNVDKKLVGMKNRVMNVVSCLEANSDDVQVSDVQMIGIKGMGGGGKTTLAWAVFNHMSVNFDGGSFVENVREVSKGSPSDVKKLQKQVLQEVLNDNNITVRSVYDGKSKIKQMMAVRKVIIVLDDVDSQAQLEALAGDRNWFKSGSKIIITSRDEQVLKAHGVHNNDIHNVNLLSREEAICLFSRYAFKRETPDNGYEELSGEVIRYASGLPLTLKVLGSHLYDRSKREWVDVIKKLETIPEDETLKRLEISYNGLKEDEKNIFLEVACMLKSERKQKEEAIRILESFGFFAEIGLKVLEQKSLITISDTEGLGLHDLIAEMGRNISRLLYPHERLWVRKDIEDVLIDDSGIEATRSIKLDYTDLDPTLIMKGLRKMKKLKFLYVNNEFSEWKIDKVSQYLPDSLQCLHWSCYGVWCLPETFMANNLVNLVMVKSNISQLWEREEGKVLNKLRFLDLKFSKLRTFDLGLTPVLERLDIRGCNDFVELCMPAECPKLNFLSVSGSKLINLNLGLTPQLEKLDLEGCYDFEEIYMPAECPNLKHLNLSGSKLSRFNIKLTPKIEELYLGECNNFVKLLMLAKCTTLKFLNLSGSKLSNLNLEMTPHLERLDLRGCKEFVELHMPVRRPKLRFLCLSRSKLTELNVQQLPHLETLDLEGCYEFVELHMSIECPNLRVLNLSGSKLSKLNIGLTPNLVELYLEQCNRFVELYTPVECRTLKILNISGSKLSNLNLGFTPRLQRLDLKRSYYLHKIQAPVECLENLVYLNLSGCWRFKCFSVNSGFGLPRTHSLAKLQITAESLYICLLHPKVNLPKFQFECLYDEPLPFSSGNLEKLLSLGLCACTNLESFSKEICGLQSLGELTLKGNIPGVLKDLYRLQSLEELTLSMKEIKCLPDSICSLKHLKSLELKSCLLLEQLPKDLDRLECLEKLIIADCDYLRDIPNSICMMNRLRNLHLPHSGMVEKLPEELGRLEFLEELNIEGTGITHLPKSILRSKNLRIVWSRGMLELYGFTPLVNISRYTAAYYIRC